MLSCLSPSDSHFMSYPPPKGGAKTVSTRFHSCIPGLVPNKYCLHEGMNNRINHSWTSPLWPHKDVQYPILTFYPRISAHPAHYFITQTQPLNSPLTSTPQVLCTCPMALLSKSLTLDHCHSLSLHPWLRAGEQNHSTLQTWPQCWFASIPLPLSLPTLHRNPGYLTSLNFELLPSTPLKPFLLPFFLFQRSASSCSRPSFSTCIQVPMWSDFYLFLLISLHSMPYPLTPNHAVPNN